MQIGRDYIGVGVGALLVNGEGGVLLMLRGEEARNERGKWALPGGAVEWGETREQAVRREVEEELGVEMTVGGELVTVDHLIKEDRQHWINTIFWGWVRGGEPRLQEEGVDLRWWGWSELRNLGEEGVVYLKRVVEAVDEEDDFLEFMNKNAQD